MLDKFGNAEGEVQNRQQILSFVHKKRRGGRVVKALDC